MPDIRKIYTMLLSRRERMILYFFSPLHPSEKADDTKILRRISLGISGGIADIGFD